MSSPSYNVITMGFDLYIRCEMMLCQETGKPYCYGTDTANNFTKIYDLSRIRIPKEHRPYLQLRGSVFHAYTTHILDSADISDAPVLDILTKYPTWADVKELSADSELEHDWTEDDHIAFHKALDWMVTDSFVQYRVHWSY